MYALVLITLHTCPSLSAPCNPENVTATLQCTLGVVSVEWEASAGASIYTVLAQGASNAATCSSEGTACDLTELQCGEAYNITVLAGHETCNTSTDASTVILTGTKMC